MGVDAKFYVRPEIGPEEIIEALKALGHKNVRYQPTSVAPHFLHIFFDSNQFDEQRMIAFFFNRKDEYFGMTCNLLSLGSNEESIKVFTQLAKIFGGVVQESDCTDDATIYRVAGGGNIRFLVERYFATNPDVSEDCDEQLEGFNKFAQERG